MHLVHAWKYLTVDLIYEQLLQALDNLLLAIQDVHDAQKSQITATNSMSLTPQELQAQLASVTLIVTCTQISALDCRISAQHQGAIAQGISLLPPMDHLPTHQISAATIDRCPLIKVTAHTMSVPSGSLFGCPTVHNLNINPQNSDEVNR